MLKAQETVLEIDLKALKENVTFIKSKINKNTKFLAVIKAFAYGSDAIKIAKTLEKVGVNYFAVAYVNEGIVLRNAGIKTPILVLHAQVVNFKEVINYCLEPSIYSQRVLKEFITIAKQLKQDHYPIHIKFNTGLNRLGFAEAEISTILSNIKETNAVKIKSLFSHLAASEDYNEKQFTLNQIQQFKTISNKIINALNYKPILHQSNTSAILNYPESHFSMVRCGIGLYGFGNEKKYNKHLKPIATLKTIISQIHYLKAGDSLGYNRAYIAKNKTVIATLPIGHADGLSRHYGNKKGFVFINNKKALIVGNVCMDMVMVDITDINCQEGDEVIVFGQQHTATTLSQNINSISYELITAISQRVKRVFIKNN